MTTFLISGDFKINNTCIYLVFLKTTKYEKSNFKPVISITYFFNIEFHMKIICFGV